MLLEVLTPDQELFNGEIESIVLPGIDGYFGILNDHAPIIAALGKGVVTLKGGRNASGTLIGKKKNIPETFEFDIKGGTVEMKNNKIIVLAD